MVLPRSLRRTDVQISARGCQTFLPVPLAVPGTLLFAARAMTRGAADPGLVKRRLTIGLAKR